jgi:hypothetical protein
MSANSRGKPATGYDMNREASEFSLRSRDAKPSPADAKVLDNLFRLNDSEGQI